MSRQFYPRFTVDDAFQSDACGEPVMIAPAYALELIEREHQLPREAYREFLLDTGINDIEPINAARLLEWLGY